MSKDAPAAIDTKDSSDVEIHVIEERAFAIFRDLSLTGVTHEGVALEAFRRAAAFQSVLNKIKSGELSAVPAAEKPRQTVKVKLQRAKNDGTGYVDVTDPNTGEPIYKEFLADPYAYCPNVPKDHPANQRFQPEDGISLDKRIAEHRKHLRASVN